MANANIQIEISALDNASRALDAIDRSLGPMARKVDRLEDEFDGVDRSINRASGSFGRMRGLLAGAITVGGITAFTNSVIEASSRAEDLKTTLETVTGSAQAGDEAFRFINDFATRTPFDIETLTETFIKLQAAGIEPTEELLTTFGDMAAVTTDKVGALAAITDLFSRTTAGGLGLEDLNRLADRGIPVFDILNDKLGVTRLEVSELGKTAEGAEQIRQALIEGLNEGFGGGMERASQNLSVTLSNLGIAANNALIKIGEGGLADAINNAAQRMTTFIAENEDLALMIGEKLGQAVTLVVDGFGIFIEKMQQAKPIFDLLGTVMNELVIPAFGFLFDAAVALAEQLGPLVEASIPMLHSLFEGLGHVLENVVVPIFNTVIDVVKSVGEWIEWVIGKISGGLEAIGNFTSATREIGSRAFDAAGNAISGAAGAVSDFGGNVADTVGNGMAAASDYVSDGVNDILGYFGWMSNEAVDNSIIPDMVDSISSHMDRLRDILSEPVAMGADIALQSMEMMGVRAEQLASQMLALGQASEASSQAFGGSFSDVLSSSNNNVLDALNQYADRGVPVFDRIRESTGMSRLDVAESLNLPSTSGERTAGQQELLNRIGQIAEIAASNTAIIRDEQLIRNSTPPELNSNTNFNISGVTINNGDRLNSPEARQYIEGIAEQIAYNVLRRNTRIGGLI